MMVKWSNKCVYIGIWLMLVSIGLQAQEQLTVKGRVYSAENREPLSGVQVYSQDAKGSSVTDSLGQFTIVVGDPDAWLRVQVDGYIQKAVALNGRKEVKVFLMPENTLLYNPTYTTPDGVREIGEKNGNVQTLNIRDISGIYALPDNALTGKMAGVQIINKGGMPGEGSVVNVRGLRSLTSENQPLIVVDGMPYFPDLKTSGVISGFSRSGFSPVNMKDVKSITLLRGADAAMYGSIGSNGVLLIETERSAATTTQVRIHSTNGIGVMNRRFPLLNSKGFKSYISDLAATRYSTLTEIIQRYPFLQDDPSAPDNYLYGHDTDWQEEIYQHSFTSDNNLQVSGGDAIARYNLSVGTTQNNGIWKNTHESKYYTHLNADIQVSRRFALFATAGLNFSEYKVMEQGLEKNTSPLMTAIEQGPVYSVYLQNRDGRNLPHFNETDSLFGVSNPAAVVSDIEGKNRSYDILVNLGGNYEFGRGLKASLIFGLYYNYQKESLFIPGNTSRAIASMFDGVRVNTLKGGAGEGLNYYLRVNATYDKLFRNKHALKASAGYQLMTSRREYDNGRGFSIQSDFYKTMGKSDASYGLTTDGYLDKWSWLNLYLTAGYGYKNQLFLDGTVTFDASSAYGDSHSRMVVLPSVRGAWAMKNSSFLRDVDGIETLTLRAEYGRSANSRYSSELGRYYYQSVAYRDLAGIIRVGLPNSKLGPEYVLSANAGLDLSLLGNRLNLNVDFYQEDTRDMLLGKTMPSAYGEEVMYDNSGEMRTRGVEVGLNFMPLKVGGFQWMLGGNIAHYQTKVLDLGNQRERFLTSADGLTLRLKEGCSPYEFYGYEAEHIFVSQRDADAAGYIAQSGTAFQAGDIKFKDMNGDHIIDDKDRKALGSATPDFYGGFFSNMNYKGFNLYVNFSYSYGNEIYNAVRKTGESMSTFTNQFATVSNRWTYDGQGTNMPRAVFGDPMENNRFSSRWIEDGSYLKLKEITLSYEYSRKLWFFNRIKVYVSGENLYTWTKYIGLDPEFAYSYDPMMSGVDMGKMPLARTGKIGVVLNF